MQSISVHTNSHALTDHNVCRMNLGRVCSDNTAPINALDFSVDGKWLVTSSDDESLHLYNCSSGLQKKQIFSKRYGCRAVKFSHHWNTVLMASQNTLGDETIRYLSLHDNKFLRYFKGHTKRVLSLDVCPTNDTFLSASSDHTVRIWDLRVSSCQGVIRTDGPTVVAYDPQGLIFAVGSRDNQVKLYDARSCDKGPFSKFQTRGPETPWNSMALSADGELILLSSASSGILLLLDSYSGDVKWALSGHTNSQQADFRPCFTPDAKYVCCGSDDGSIHVWSVATGKTIGKLEGHKTPPLILGWNPTKLMLASAEKHLGLWLPRPASNSKS